MHGRKPETTTATHRFRGEEGLEHALPRLVVDPDAVVGDRKSDVAAWANALVRRDSSVDFGGPGANGDVSVAIDGVGRIENEVDDRLLDLRRVGPDSADGRIGGDQ